MLICESETRGYFLHFVLHDWQEEQRCLTLGHLRDAMDRGFLKTLIKGNETPDMGAAWPIIPLDWSIKAIVAFKERTEAHGRRSIESAA